AARPERHPLAWTSGEAAVGGRRRGRRPLGHDARGDLRSSGGRRRAGLALPGGRRGDPGGPGAGRRVLRVQNGSVSIPARHHPGAYLVWVVGLAAYLLAVFHRSSLAVAGLEASERFDISAAQLSSFVMLQLLVYTGMQVPVGLAVDRFGPRAVMLTGAVMLTCSQAAFAFAESYGTALTARFFVGMGDAMTFVCLLRLVNAWFAPRMIPQIMLMTGPIGQLGGVIAAAPMTWALGHLGWTDAYLVAAGCGLVVTIAVLVWVHDEPTARSVRGPALSWVRIRSSLADSWENPGTRLGFCMHFVTQFSSTVIGLLWGYPYFVEGEHTSEAFAGTLLS